MCEYCEGYWYCPNCDIELLPESVTYEENCEFCGEPVEWIDLPHVR